MPAPTAVVPIIGLLASPARMVHGMTSERGDGRRLDGSAPAPARDAAHLDEDAEALEDPVHRGDAKHQHDQHESRKGGDPAQRD